MVRSSCRGMTVGWRPWAKAADSADRHVAPGPQDTVRAPASTVRSSRPVRSRVTDPLTATAWPPELAPVPRGVSFSPRSLASCATRATSPALRGRMTAAGPPMTIPPPSDAAKWRARTPRSNVDPEVRANSSRTSVVQVEGGLGSMTLRRQRTGSPAAAGPARSPVRELSTFSIRSMSGVHQNARPSPRWRRTRPVLVRAHRS